MAWLSPLQRLKESQQAPVHPGKLAKGIISPKIEPAPEKRPRGRPRNTPQPVRIIRPANQAAQPQKLGKLEQYQAVVDVAIAAMSTMDDLADRAEHKRRVLKDIWPFVDEYVAQGSRYANSVAVMAMIWSFDTGDIERALRLGKHLVGQHCHTMPRRFNREMEDFIGDEIYDWARRKLVNGESAGPFLEEAIETAEQGRWRMHPIVLGKLCAMAAKHAERLDDWPAVLAWCEKAEALNPKAGVKTLRLIATAKTSGVELQLD